MIKQKPHIEIPNMPQTLVFAVTKNYLISMKFSFHFENESNLMIPVIVTTAIFHCCKVAESGKDQDTGREEPHRAPARSRVWTPRHRTGTAATCPGALCHLLPATLDRLCLTDVYFCRLAIIIPFYFLITIQVNLDFHTKELIAKSMTQPTLQSFDAAQSRVYQLMEQDSYTRFLKSDIYLGLIEARPQRPTNLRRRSRSFTYNEFQDVKSDVAIWL